MMQESGQGSAHGSLPPMESWSFVGQKRILSIVKIARGILHIGNSPVRDLLRSRNTVGMQLAQINKRLNTLGGALYIQRPSLKIVIPRSAVLTKKGIHEKVVALLQLALVSPIRFGSNVPV